MVYFLLGKPTDDCEDIDYIPTLFAHSKKDEKQSKERQTRLDRRRQVAEDAERNKENQRKAKDSQEAAVTGLPLLQQSCKVDAVTQTTLPVFTSAETQTLASGSAYIIAPNVVESAAIPFGIKLLEGNDKCTKFYTGLSSWSVFNHIATNLCAHFPKLSSKLSPFDCLLLTLMRLRLNLSLEDLAYRFRIGSTTAADIFTKYIDVMFIHLKFLIKWPTQELCHANMPQVFKDLYPRTRSIIDCSEIFIERPYSYQARAQTYSCYKKHNTVKFLISITPCGAVSYLSKCWGGRATDKCITMHSDFLQLLDHGDIVLADHGFDIADDIAIHGATLVIPSFTRGKQQLSLQEVERSQKISKVCVHVERVIGLLKNKYTILQGTLPVTFLKRKQDTHYAFIDKVLTVCSALVNLSPSVVPQ